MKYEYNGNLLEDDRIDLVANEIIEKYPKIYIENANKAATLEKRISSNVTLTDKLNRIYNIMLVNSDNKEILISVYNDYLNLISKIDGEGYDKYYNIAQAIYNYLNNLSDFPYISDFE